MTKLQTVQAAMNTQSNHAWCCHVISNYSVINITWFGLLYHDNIKELVLPL